MNDSYLLESLVRGDAGSFNDLVEMYEKMIYRFIYHMVHDVQTAEDLTQDVFIKVYQNLYKINNEFLLKPWIFKIAYNITLNYLKRNRRNIIYSIDENIPGGDCIGQYETRQVILESIQSLKPDCRAIFILKLVEDLSFEQIAAILGISTGAVKMKFYRNKKELVNKLSQSFKEV